MHRANVGDIISTYHVVISINDAGNKVFRIRNLDMDHEELERVEGERMVYEVLRGKAFVYNYQYYQRKTNV